MHVVEESAFRESLPPHSYLQQVNFNEAILGGIHVSEVELSK